MSNVPQSTLSNTLQALSQALSALGPDQLGLRHDPRLDELITSLPRLTEADLGSQCDAVCPICLIHFRAHLAEEEIASAMDSPAHAEQDLGVTRLENTCRHIFCRKDISTWIRQSRNSCPTCRRPLLPPLPEEDGLPPGATVTIASPNEDGVVQIADDVIREVLEALGPLDGPASSDQADVVRRLVETLLQSTPELPLSEEQEEQEYPDRSEFGMYS